MKDKKILQVMGEIFFPPTCPVCGEVVKDGKQICLDCESRLNFTINRRCLRCGKVLKDQNQAVCKTCKRYGHYFKEGFGVVQYDDVVRGAIARFKYHNKREYGKFFGRLISKELKEVIPYWKPQVLIPVPIHKSKYILRGFNQAEVLASELEKITGIKSASKILLRTKKTPPQKQLDRIGRINNLRNAFDIDIKELKRLESKMGKIKTAILIDDIYTTGATIDACAKLLLDNGFSEIYYVSIATGIGD